LFRRTRLLLATALATVLMVFGASMPSWAAGGSFDWTFTGNYGIASRNWTTTTTNDIWIKVTYQSKLEDSNGHQRGYDITLRKKSGSQVQSSRDGQGTGSYVFKSVGAGTYYFQLYVTHEVSDVPTITINGTTYYDGAKP
jgi:hypothetical protein